MPRPANHSSPFSDKRQSDSDVIAVPANQKEQFETGRSDITTETTNKITEGAYDSDDVVGKGVGGEEFVNEILTEIFRNSVPPQLETISHCDLDVPIMVSVKNEHL